MKNLKDNLWISGRWGMKCQLIEADNYNLLVSWDDKRVLIPKHSIKYVIL
jgi:sRNA-binding regulator protein Hfq